MVRRSYSTLKSLERRLVKERAEVAINRFVDTLLIHWEGFVDAGMDGQAMVRRLRVSPASMNTWPRTIRLINQCIKEGREPTPRQLINSLTPWKPRFR